MSEQPDLFPEDAKKAKELKKTDILHRLKKRHKGTGAIQYMRNLAQALRDKSKEEAHDSESVIVKPKYK